MWLLRGRGLEGCRRAMADLAKCFGCQAFEGLERRRSAAPFRPAVHLLERLMVSPSGTPGAGSTKVRACFLDRQAISLGRW